MAIYCFINDSLQKVEATTFNSEGILERKHLQEALKRQIEVIAPECLVIAEEFSEWTDSQRRIDLLAIAKDGALVVIELKRDETGVHMELQALRYAAMVSTLTFSRAVEIYKKYLNTPDEKLDAENKLLKFLDWAEPKEEDFAFDVRIVLVSSDFSKELTTSVMWLNERNIDIRCIRLVPHKFENRLFVDVQQIIPLPEAESYQVKIKQQSEERRESRVSAKDFTKYFFNNEYYNKRQLVLAVIKHWVTANQPKSISELCDAFPQKIHSGGLFVPVAEAQKIYEEQTVSRHFLGEQDVIEFPDSKYAISNQWGIHTIRHFLDCARELGFPIKESIQ